MTGFRAYEPHRDQSAVQRIWQEIGWLEKGKEAALDVFLGGSRVMVAQVNGAAECVVLSAAGTIRYLDQDQPFAAVTGVSTSRVARKQGLASRLTARVVADEVAGGASVVGLGMFEQGYYNQLGFGTGGYEHWIGFDPARLKVEVKPRIPRRISGDDWAAVHASRLARLRGHGACSFVSPALTQAEMMLTDKGFGLGFRSGDELTHHVWCTAKGVESGPYTVLWMSFRDADQFLELMALIKSLGDQVRLVRMREPPGIQMQDMIEQPFKQRQISAKSDFEANTRAVACWQMRICDLEACMEGTRLRGDTVRFNLCLSDPIERLLSDGPWRGVGGEYVVTLGPVSRAEPGRDAKLPTLTTSVGAFTRMWLGVRPATGLAVTDDLAGPRGLLERLDWVLCIPEPKPDWDF